MKKKNENKGKKMKKNNNNFKLIKYLYQLFSLCFLFYVKIK